MTILCYHSVDDDWSSRLSIPTPEFERHCRWLARHRTVVPLADLASRLDARHRTPARSAAITFDDGWAGVHERAWPVLRRHGLPFTVFVVVDTLVGDGIPVNWVDDPGNRPLTTLSRDQVMELAADGVEIGSHSCAHHDLTTLDPLDCLADLRRSRETLSDLLGREVTSVAYPRGRHDGVVRAAARQAGYHYGFALPEAREVTDRFAIDRVGIYPGNTTRTLRIKTSPRYLDVRLSPWYRRLTRTKR